MDEYILNVNRKEMDPKKRAILDEFDEILKKNRSDAARDLDRQVRYLDVKDLFKCFTI